MSKNPEQPRKALGKGLSALLPARSPSHSPNQQTNSTPEAPGNVLAGVLRVPIHLVDPNPVQPRTVFDAERLAQLAQSIRTNGIIQPLIVQRNADRYRLVAGERRWRAARLAAIEEVPVVVQDVADEKLLELALIENIQREDLNPIEVAQALERLGRELGLSHEELGQRTGKDRTTVTNLLRLLRLPQDIQVLVAEGRLSMGHARAILSLPTEEQQRELAEKVAAQGLSVRQVERLVQAMSQSREGTSDTGNGSIKEDPNVAAAVRELESALGTRVRIVAQSADRGRIEIEYYSFEELDRIYNQILGKS